jgi:arsenate reductase (glutaredoxin)
MAKKLTFYGYAKCGTCRKAMGWLDVRRVGYDAVDITDQPPPASLLRKVLKQGRYTLRDLFNKSGELYRSMNMKDRLPTMSQDEAVKLLSEQGKLVKRPIVTDGERVTVGFDEAAYEEAWAER